MQNWLENPDETQNISVQIIDEEEQKQIEASHKFFLSIMGMFNSGHNDYSEKIKEHVSEAIEAKFIRGGHGDNR